MSTRINTNIGALNALKSLNDVGDRMSVAQLRLATGKRINSAGDDAGAFGAIFFIGGFAATCFLAILGAINFLLLLSVSVPSTRTINESTISLTLIACSCNDLDAAALSSAVAAFD